ncbi:MAG TPA: c-type cytochrome [Gaiellaceae bacterium]|nr:c-type cytochrome [Gaiellaceae bacterium]
MTDEKHAERGTRILPAVVAAGIAVAIAVGIVAYAAGHYGERTTTVTTQAAPSTTSPVTYPTVSPQVAAGAHTFVQFACAQCHGMQGSGGVDPAVPALKTVGQSLTVAQLTHIIDHGLGESANPKVPYMPVWGEVLSKTQVSNLVAYIRAGLPSVADTQPVSVPSGQGAAVAGAALYVRYGCINCHGPNGLGGVPNPLSPDKTIPPLSGQGFRHDFPTDKAIAGVIRSGSVIGRAPIVSMPHWGGILSDQQISQLIAYLKTLK